METQDFEPNNLIMALAGGGHALAWLERFQGGDQLANADAAAAVMNTNLATTGRDRAD